MAQDKVRTCDARSLQSGASDVHSQCKSEEAPTSSRMVCTTWSLKHKALSSHETEVLRS
jgi:hypothetical protein